MRVAWQNQNLRRMEKIEPPPLKMLIGAFPLGNDLKAFLLLLSAFSSFPCHCQLKPTTATTTWNSNQMLYFAIFCLFRRFFALHGLILFLYFSNRKSCLASKHVYIAEVWTIAKSLPLLRICSLLFLRNRYNYCLANVLERGNCICWNMQNKIVR